MERKRRKVKVKTFCFSSLQSLSFVFVFFWLAMFFSFPFFRTFSCFPSPNKTEGEERKEVGRFPKELWRLSLFSSHLSVFLPSLLFLFWCVSACFFFGREKRSTLLRIYRRDPKDWQRERVGSTTGSLCLCSWQILVFLGFVHLGFFFVL